MSDSPVVQSRRWRVTGRVQGVFFRASARQQALQLGLIGYANNLPDGSVEVLACGAMESLNQLAEWLWHGPPAAHVTGVQLLEQRDQALAENGFVTG
jgi:acylphosphatase